MRFPDLSFIAYSGTTDERFRAFTSITENGIALHQKDTGTGPYSQRVFYTDNIAEALIAALSKSGLKGDPVIMVGRLPFFYRFHPWKALPKGRPFQVTQVWIPTPASTNIIVDYDPSSENKLLEGSFQRFFPKDLLNQ